MAPLGRVDCLGQALAAISDDIACRAVIDPSRIDERWWAWEDLNFRPHAYQARALTN